ncbi:hypothetical protein SH449x_001309 [Pirellulaceae bacterium SH449]
MRMGIALARKIAVLAWAMLRDEKDWDPNTMITVTETYGKMNLGLKETLKEMPVKENSDQRESRLRKEAKAALKKISPNKAISAPSSKPTSSKSKPNQ